MPKILLLGLVALIAVGGYVVYYKSDKLPPGLQERASNIKEGVTSVASRGKDVGPAVMGITTESKKIFQEDDAGKPIHQRALEFTQYQYCKVVVDQFEKTEDDNSPSDPSSESAE